MPLFGPGGVLLGAFLGAVLADLGGNRQTRWFTRRAFAIVALHAFGVSPSGLLSFGADAWGMLPI